MKALLLKLLDTMKVTKIELYKDKPGKYILYHDGNIKEFKPFIKLENIRT